MLIKENALVLKRGKCSFLHILSFVLFIDVYPVLLNCKHAQVNEIRKQRMKMPYLSADRFPILNAIHTQKVFIPELDNVSFRNFYHARRDNTIS